MYLNIPKEVTRAQRPKVLNSQKQSFNKRDCHGTKEQIFLLASDRFNIKSKFE